ncbi:hypothetical protein [[Clostridium] dakarense]|uniref:hypothetical protein n=1 Tax=Faecalimicrobium dakarense TaxID=1301100 RepID=UPI0004B171F0|nr:hypothetical protein [[Clostridium] dakarense]
MDLLYLKNIINHLIPERQEFIGVYKLALLQNELEVDLLDLKKVFNIIPLKLFTILNIFKELSLLDFELKCNQDYKTKSILIKSLPKPDKKLNLDESKILNNLKRLKQEYEESY